MKPLRLAAIGCLVVPPAVNAVLHLLDPLTADDNSKLIGQAVAHPTLTALMQGQYLLLLFAPGALLLAGFAARSRRLAVLGGGILCVAALASAPGLSENSVLAAAARSAQPQLWVETFATLDQAPGAGVLNALKLVWIAGNLVGFVLLGIALLRSRAVPAWCAWTVMVAVAVNAIGHLLPGSYLVAAAWLALALGLAGCCLSMSDEYPVQQPRPEHSAALGSAS